MTKTSTPSRMPEWPMPVDFRADDTVEKIYTQPSQDGLTVIPDLGSSIVMGKYLVSRHIDEPVSRHRLVFDETGWTLPGITRIPAGTKDVAHLEFKDGWVVSPKVSVGILAASLILPNVFSAAQDTVEAFEGWGHGIYRYYNPVQPVHTTVQETTVVPGTTRLVTVDIPAANKAGQSTVDAAAIQQFENNVAAATQGKKTNVSIEVTGRSSDDYSTDDDIGRLESPGQDMSDERAAVYGGRLTADYKGTVPVATSVDQNVITPEKKAELINLAKSKGYKSLTQAIRAVDAGKEKDPTLVDAVTANFSSKRGVTLTAKITENTPSVTTVTPKTVETPGVDDPPANPKHPYFFFPFTIPPIPKMRRIFETVPKKVWKFIPFMKVRKPRVVTEDAEHAWVRLRPEAIQEDGTLVSAPWAKTRKFEHLMRDDRIHKVLRATGTIEGQEEEKSMRVFFVDHDPADETVALFSDLFKKFISIRDAEIAGKISGIFVYPSKNIGKGHTDPKIGLGVDKQDAKSVLGSCTPILELVEMHMDNELTAEKLQEAFADWMGPAWTVSHEVAGHGSSIVDKPLKVRRVLSTIPNSYVTVQGAWRGIMAGLHARLGRLDNPMPERPIQWDIHYKALDANGEPVTISERVGKDDPRLQHALAATIFGYDITGYAGEDYLEGFAETAASTVTGIGAPFSEAGVVIRKHTTDSGKPAAFATTYMPDKEAQELVANHLGGKPGTIPLEIVSDVKDIAVSLVDPLQDPFLVELMKSARSNRTLINREMVAILAQTHRRIAPRS